MPRGVPFTHPDPGPAMLDCRASDAKIPAGDVRRRGVRGWPDRGILDGRASLRWVLGCNW